LLIIMKSVKVWMAYFYKIKKYLDIIQQKIFYRG